MDLAENAQLRRQVDMLQKYLSTVLEHSEIEVQDHQISERIWNKEKSQLQEQIRILQASGVNTANTVANQSSDDDNFELSRSELEESIIRLTKERDELRENVKSLTSQLTTAAIDGLNDRKNNFDKTPSDQNFSDAAKSSIIGGNDEPTADRKEVDVEESEGNVNRPESSVTDERVLARIIDENTELNNKIDIYDKQLEDAKIAVLKAASVIQKLNKDIDHERKQKEAYKNTCEELKQKLKERLDELKNKK